MTTTPTVGRVSSWWGKRKAKIPGMTTFHRGVDIAVPVGTDVVAPLAGVVAAAKYNLIRGHYVVVDHGGGWSTSSQHLSRRLVKAGDRVAEGQRIGLSGRTGNVTGPHNHTEVRWQGTPVDPAPWYAARGMQLGAACAATTTTPTVAQRPTERPEEDDVFELILKMYREELGREADVGGVATWLDVAAAHGAVAMVEAFRQSKAERATVLRAYRVILDRAPSERDYAERAGKQTVAELWASLKAAKAAGQR